MMGNGMLSQEEIDALLSGSLEPEETAEADMTYDSLTDIEKDAIGEIANISMGTAATTLSQLVGRRVQITTPRVDLTTARRIFDEYPLPHVLIEVRYSRGINGNNILVLSREDGSVIVDLMMGGTGSNPTTDLSELQISGISEAMNQMMGSAATSMSTMFSSVIDITPPKIYVSENQDEVALIQGNLESDDLLVRIQFRLVIEDIIDSIMLQVLPLRVAREMSEKLIGQMSAPAAKPKPESSRVQTENVKPIEQPRYQAPPPPSESSWQPPFDISAPPPPKNHTNFVQQAQFSPLSPGSISSQPNNLGLIFDVPLQVSVELGKATKTIKEILELGPGAVIELDRLAGEPVDMIVNGKLIAKCEVVVINETFGIRITEIISPSDRINTLN